MISRRNFLGLSGSALASGLLFNGHTSLNHFSPGTGNKTVIPVIHATDLYHVHGDPDDHWDLASLYALTYRGLIDLKGIVIDFPAKPSLGDPDVMGIAQMNYYTGLTIPSVVGTSCLMKNRNDAIPGGSGIELQGVNWIINTLRNSPARVVIHIVGTATNIAFALKKEPELFNKKCAAIYLNAGSGPPEKDNKLEYNVSLDHFAYAAIFDAPCPVYWMPCFNIAGVTEVGEYGTYYKFLQEDILPFLPRKLQNFFLYMYGRKQSNQWFTYLNGSPEADLLALNSRQYRNMWCTAGFLFTAGKKVTTDGEIVNLNSEQESVFSFRPVSITCDEQGFTSWAIKNDSRDRFIFHVDDKVNYQSAMTLALKMMLLQLPE